jgi:hypothetical protein
MAVKQIKQSASALAKYFRDPGFGKYAVAGGGIMAAYGGTKWMANPGANVNAPDGENPFSSQSFKNAGYWERMNRLGALGMATPTMSGGGFSGAMGGVGNALGNVATYNIQRIKDTFATTVGGETALSRSFMVGAKYGGAAGAGVGLMASIASWGRIPFSKSVPILGLLGAVSGGYGARKVNLDVIRSVNEAKKNALNRRKITNKAKAVGPGFKTWTTGARRMGRPGHLGMDGSVPFSMHKARHRSTV